MTDQNGTKPTPGPGQDASSDPKQAQSQGGEPKKEAKTRSYKVVSPIKRNKKLLKPGDKVSLPEEEAAVLLKSNAIETVEQ